MKTSNAVVSSRKRSSFLMGICKVWLRAYMPEVYARLSALALEKFPKHGQRYESKVSAKLKRIKP